MKKYAITSICTLVLSLLGAFGLNQNSVNSNANSIATDTVENVQYIDENQSLQNDNQKKAAKLNADTKEAAVDNEATAEQAKVNANDNMKEADSNIQKTNSGLQNASNDIQKTKNNKQSTNSNAQNTNSNIKNVNNDKQTKLQVTPVASLDSEKCTVQNGQIYIGSVNISDCKNVDDVVARLKSQGYANITADSIKNNKSLQDVLKYINKSTGNTAGQSGGANTPAPAKNPANTPATTPSKTPAANKPSKPAATAPANSGINSYASEVLRLVNVERAKAGLPALTTNATLTAAADKRAQETKQSFSHTRPDGRSAFTVLAEYGISYRAAGENIAYGQKTAQEVVNGWMNSPGHRANILNSSFGKVGIGVFESNGVIYWTQLFTD